MFDRVFAVGGDSAQQIAALLHDAIEDGKATADELLAAGVPSEAVTLVKVLTRRKGETYNEYVLRVCAYRSAVIIKKADLEDNSDPERLAVLDPMDAARLSKQYEAAKALLHGMQGDEVAPP